MSFVGEPFVFDVFVSYSHGPNASGLWQSYSNRLVSDLKSHLLAYEELSESFVLYFDVNDEQGARVNEMQPLSNQLELAVRGSGLLVILMTDFYLKSPTWCPDERNWWFDQQNVLRLSPDGRIAVVRICRQEKNAKWPPGLCDIRGFQLPGFYFYDKADVARFPYGWPDPEIVDRESRGKYTKSIIELASIIFEMLCGLKVQLQSGKSRREQAARLRQGPIVYLHARASQASQWSTMSKVFWESGIQIVPTQIRNHETNKDADRVHREYRIETMSAADALLLLGSEEDRVVEADLMSIGRLDRHSAISRASKDLPCAFMDCQGIGNRSPVLREIANRLDIKWLEGKPSELPSITKEWLEVSGAQMGEPQ